jgi:hypothetical protein
MARPRLLLLLRLLMLAAGLAHGLQGVSPTCMINGNPCPLPVGWDVDWSLWNSSACMPESGPNGYNNISFAPTHHWGMASLDWTVGRGTWLDPANKSRSTCEATSAANCAAVKRSGMVKRCGIYHNIELALEWWERKKKRREREKRASLFIF